MGVEKWRVTYTSIGNINERKPLGKEFSNM